MNSHFEKRFEVPLSQLTLVNFLLSTPATVNIHMSFDFYNKPKMARTKSSVRRGPAGPLDKTPRALPRTKDAPAVPRPHRFRPSTRARMEIRKWRFRLPERLLIHRLPFGRLVREIAQDFMAAPRFQAQAI